MTSLILASIPFFDRVAGYLQVIVDSIARSASSFISSAKFLTETIPLFYSVIEFMPLMVSSCVFFVLGISILKFILGR